jgi:two-component system cell cycle response regulator DivK
MSGELVLIVEDNDKNLKLARDLLHFKGFRTIEAGTGSQGISLATEHQPDLVLMDIQLPDMDGKTALRHLRAKPETAALRVVALTAFAMGEDRETLLGAGFDGYISKPIDVRQFPDQVSNHCRAGGRSEELN